MALVGHKLNSATRRRCACSIKEDGSHAEIIQGARNALAPLLEDVGVDHSGSNIAVPEQLLDSADVGSSLQQVGGERMAVLISILPMKELELPFIIITIRFMENTANSFVGYDATLVIKW